MKQRDDFAGLRIPPGNVRPLVLVAVQTGKSKVLQAGLPAVLPGYDVVRVKGTQIPGLGHMTILTPGLSPVPYSANKSRIHELRASPNGLKPDFRRATRA